MQRKLTLVAVIAAFLAGPAPAGDMDGMISVDVLDGGPTGAGSYLTGLRLTLGDGWKTYWRAPGDAGIPPRFSWNGSRNVGGVDITWPTPEVFVQNGLRSIGYAEQVVLPLEVTARRDGRPIRLRGAIDLGVCKDICVPGTLRFDHVIDTGAQRNPVIAAAMAQRPLSAPEAGVRGAACRLSPAGDGMRIEARITMPPAGSGELAVIEPGNPALWVSDAETRRQGDLLVASSDLASNDGTAFALDRSAIRITILSSGNAVEIRGCPAG